MERLQFHRLPAIRTAIARKLLANPVRGIQTAPEPLRNRSRTALEPHGILGGKRIQFSRSEIESVSGIRVAPEPHGNRTGCSVESEKLADEMCDLVNGAKMENEANSDAILDYI